MTLRLIALLLGRLRMDIDEAIQTYTSLITTVFSQPSASGSSVFDRQVLEEQLKNIIQGVTNNADEILMDDESACKTCVCCPSA